MTSPRCGWQECQWPSSMSTPARSSSHRFMNVKLCGAPGPPTPTTWNGQAPEWKPFLKTMIIMANHKFQKHHRQGTSDVFCFINAEATDTTSKKQRIGGPTWKNQEASLEFGPFWPRTSWVRVDGASIWHTRWSHQACLEVSLPDAFSRCALPTCQNTGRRPRGSGRTARSGTTTASRSHKPPGLLQIWKHGCFWFPGMCCRCDKRWWTLANSERTRSGGCPLHEPMFRLMRSNPFAHPGQTAPTAWSSRAPKSRRYGACNVEASIGPLKTWVVNVAVMPCFGPYRLVSMWSLSIHGLGRAHAAGSKPFDQHTDLGGVGCRTAAAPDGQSNDAPGASPCGGAVRTSRTGHVGSWHGSSKS